MKYVTDAAGVVHRGYFERDLARANLHVDTLLPRGAINAIRNDINESNSLAWLHNDICVTTCGAIVHPRIIENKDYVTCLSCLGLDFAK